jgi:SHAQKYF class myb-like DNA-binding protein
VSATAADEASSGGEGAVGGDGGGGGVSTRAATAAPAAAEPLKTRLRWTPELHALFTVAVEAAGGLTNASPNATLSQMRARVAPGTALPPLTVAHLKSHLQKCRLEIQRRAAAAAANAAAAAADAGDGEVERPRKRRRNKPQPLAPAASAVDAAQRLLQLSAAAATQAGPGEAHAT